MNLEFFFDKNNLINLEEELAEYIKACKILYMNQVWRKTLSEFHEVLSRLNNEKNSILEKISQELELHTPLKVQSNIFEARTYLQNIRNFRLGKHLLAWLYESEKDYETAYIIFNENLEFYPSYYRLAGIKLSKNAPIWINETMEESEESARFIYEKGLPINFPYSYASLGNWYLNGYGSSSELEITERFDKAEECFNTVISQGFSYGYLYKGILQMRKLHVLGKDDLSLMKITLELFKKAEEMGNYHAKSWIIKYYNDFYSSLGLTNMGRLRIVVPLFRDLIQIDQSFQSYMSKDELEMLQNLENGSILYQDVFDAIFTGPIDKNKNIYECDRFKLISKKDVYSQIGAIIQGKCEKLDNLGRQRVEIIEIPQDESIEAPEISIYELETIFNKIVIRFSKEIFENLEDDAIFEFFIVLK